VVETTDRGERRYGRSLRRLLCARSSNNRKKRPRTLFAANSLATPRFGVRPITAARCNGGWPKSLPALRLLLRKFQQLSDPQMTGEMGGP
jgi:hypothetical protein